MSKKLFMLRYKHNGKPVPDRDVYFNSKMGAKYARDSGQYGDKRLIVSYGPDHRKYKGGE